MSRYRIKPRIPKFQAVIMIVFGVVFMGIAGNMFGSIGGIGIIFMIVPVVIIIQGVMVLLSKDSTGYGGYVIDEEESPFQHKMSHSNVQGDELTEKLKKLKELKEQGLIDEEDYEKKVDELLNKF